REPQLAHKEIVKLKIEPGTDVRVWPLLMRQFDAQTDGFAAGLRGAAVGRFHNARTASGTDDKAPGMLTESQRPSGDAAGKFPRLFVIARHSHGRASIAQGDAPAGSYFPRKGLQALQVGLGAVAPDNARRSKYDD